MAEISVLVVDDQEPFRAAMRSVVDETDGFRVVGSATTGEEALAVAAALRPDLVLMDVNLPGIDGIEATRRLIAAGAAPVVVLLSTYDEDHFDLDGCGATAYVAKAAFGPDRLLAAWAPALDADRSSRPDRDAEHQDVGLDGEVAADGVDTVADALEVEALCGDAGDS